VITLVSELKRFGSQILSANSRLKNVSNETAFYLPTSRVWSQGRHLEGLEGSTDPPRIYDFRFFSANCTFD